MSWQNIEGHQEVAEMFARAFFRSRLEGSFLFTGPAGVGKRTFAFALAKTLLCLKTAAWEGTGRFPDDFEKFQPCGECESCRLFDLEDEEIPETIIRGKTTGKAPKRKIPDPPKRKKADSDGESLRVPSHPDFYYVSKPEDKTQIPLEYLIGTKDDRMQSGLCFDLTRFPFLGKRKIAVIDDADTLNAEGANALLKTLEEPPGRSVIILIGTSASKQLPTIRSRCQIVRFAPLAPDTLARILLDHGKAESLEEGIRRAKFAEGSFQKAAALGDPTFETFRAELLRELTRPYPDLVEFSQKLNAFTDAAGKDSQTRRFRLSVVLGWAADFYRDLVRVLSGDEKFLTRSPAMAPYLRKTSENWPGGPLTAAAAAERTVTALGQIEQNANVPYIIEAWLADLRKILDGQG